ncbi:MAG: Rpp14/Pop5 family protein [Nanobdellota archaeon]
MELNPLKPSIREKKRYICFKSDSEGIEKQNMKNSLLERIKKWIGEKEFSNGRVIFMDKIYNKDNSKGIISCNHKQCRDVKAGILLNDDFKTHVLYVSGSLKKAKEKLGEVI